MAVFGSAPVTEERLVDFRGKYGKGIVFGAVCAQATTIFVFVRIIQGLIHVPDATIPVSPGIEVCFVPAGIASAKEPRQSRCYCDNAKSVTTRVHDTMWNSLPQMPYKTAKTGESEI
jgi:hypothetical protein